MLTPETLEPVIALAVIAAIHAGYYWRFAKVATQQSITVDDYSHTEPTNRSCESSCSQPIVWQGQGTLIQGGASAASVAASAFEIMAQDIAAEIGGRVVLPDDTRLRDGIFLDVLICQGDLYVDGDACFVSPVKVSGDLFIAGKARFSGFVTVNGSVTVQGTVQFAEGLVCRKDIVVPGHVEIGAAEAKGWAVVSEFRVAGKCLLTGRITETQPASRERAA